MGQNLFLERDSLVEFLYLDRQRISSLTGQLSDKGTLIGLKSVVAKSQAREATAGGTIGVAKAQGQSSRTSSESSEETYDPFWTHAYSFLKDLEANFAVALDCARMGSLVKFEGLVQFVDLKIMRNLWEPSVRAFLLSQSQPAQRMPPITRKNKHSKPQQTTSELSESVKTGLDLLREVPHLLHMTFLAEGGFRFWAAAQPDFLTISSEHLTMKFGAVVDGLWTVVGIVDGRIGDPPKPLPINPLLDGFVSAMASLREVVGRPKDHWGLTPIAIYAPLQGAAEAQVQQTGAQSVAQASQTQEPT
jgi:hypothetical protein